MGSESPSIGLLTFSQTSLTTHVSANTDEILARIDQDACTWIHAVNLHAESAIAKVLEPFGLPASLARRILEPAPFDFDASDDVLFKKFRVIRAVAGGAPADDRRTPRLLIRRLGTGRFDEASGSFILGKNVLLLFEDRPSGLFDAFKGRLVANPMMLQRHGVDYVLYQLIRSLVVENYESLFEQFRDLLEDAEDRLLGGDTGPAIYQQVVRFRQELGPFERSLIHASDFAGALTRETPAVFSPATLKYFTQDLANELDKLDKEFVVIRERSSELVQLYRDNVNTQMNQIMRTLTVVSTIALPLSFLTGFYGMNFPNMPATHSSWGYPVALVLMLAMLIGSLIYVKRKKWL